MCSEFKTYEITESFIHLNYLGPSDEDNPATRTVFIHKVNLIVSYRRLEAKLSTEYHGL